MPSYNMFFLRHRSFIVAAAAVASVAIVVVVFLVYAHIKYIVTITAFSFCLTSS